MENVSGASITTQQPDSLPNSGPATITVGIATATPSARVIPQIGVQIGDRDERPGMRRYQAVHHRQTGQRRNPDGDQRLLGSPGDQIDHGHQQGGSEVEEHRQPDDRADQRHGPRNARGDAWQRRCRRFRRRRQNREKLGDIAPSAIKCPRWRRMEPDPSAERINTFSGFSPATLPTAEKLPKNQCKETGAIWRW